MFSSLEINKQTNKQEENAVWFEEFDQFERAVHFYSIAI